MIEEMLTPFFPGAVKPVRKGVYQRIAPWGELIYSYWNGRKWLTGHVTIQAAHKERNRSWSSVRQEIPWRGVNKAWKKAGGK